MKSSSDVLESILQNSKNGLSDQFMRWKVWRKWDEIVGPTISAQSAPVGYNNGILYIWVKNSVWMQEMLFLAGPLKEKVNKFTGKTWAQKIHFTLNRHEVPDLDDAEGIKDTLNSIDR